MTDLAQSIAYEATYLHGFLTGAGLVGMVMLTAVIAITFEKKLRDKNND